MTIKDRVKKLCKARGVSLNQLEHELSFGKGYLSKLGNSTPNAAKIQQIAEYFNVTVDFLINGESAKKDVAPTMNDIDLELYINNVINKLQNHSVGSGSFYLNGVELSDMQTDMFSDDLQNALNRVVKLGERSKSE